MNRPVAPLIQHFRVPLVKIADGHHTARVKWLRLDWIVTVTPNLMIRIHEGMGDDPFELVAPLQRHAWGYGASAKMAGFPYTMALMRDGDGWCVEIWSEAPKTAKAA